MWRLNGQCGDVAPGPLPVLVGPPVDRCPTAMMLGSPDLELASLMPGLAGPGPLAAIGHDAITLPPRLSAALQYCRSLAEHHRQEVANGD